MGEDVKTTTIKGFFWRFFERCGAQVVTFIVSIILARLLDPKIYGTIALVTIFTSILEVFVNSGLGNALIQKKNADDLDFSTVFFFNVGTCFLLYALIFFCAPLIANFYEMPELTLIIRVLSLTLVISGVRNIQQAYVSRHMLFKKFFYSTIGGTIGSAVVGIYMAYAGFGVWALVWQQIFNVLVGTIVLWIVVKWRPKLQFSFQRLKGLFSFGWKLLVSGLIDVVYNNARALIIGKKYSEEDLGLYNKGKMFPNLIVTNVNLSIDSVLLPIISKEQDDKARVKAMTRRSIKTSVYIMAPLMIGMAVCAEPMIRLLLTEKWLGCVLFLQIFCITYIFYPVHTANLNAINAMGRSDYFLGLEIIKKVIGVAAILITMWISVEAMAYSLLATALLSTIINAFPNKKLLGYSWFEQMWDILPYIGLAVLMGVPVYFLGYLPLPIIVVLLVQVVTGAVIYVGVSAVFKLEIFTYLLDTLKKMLKRGKKTKMPKKKVLLLGGSRYLLPVIKACHELGYYVITCDYLPDNIAHKYSDEYHNISIIDKEAVLELAKELKVDGVMSFACDPGVVMAAYVAETLGLPTHPYASVQILQNKALFRQFLTDNGFNVPKAKGYTDPNEALKDVDFFTWPVIVKPTDSAGSKGVTRVDTPEKLEESITYALSFSHSNEFIIEEFIEKKGDSSDTDCFSVDGELVYASFNNQKFDEKADNPYTPAAYTWPSEMSKEGQIELRAELQRLMKLLNLQTSIYNVETREGMNGKPYIMEVSPRGGGNRLAEVLEYATGAQLIKNAIRAAVGDPVIPMQDPEYNGYWAEIILHADKDGRFEELALSEEIKPYVHEIDLWVNQGDEVHAFTAANYAIGTLVLRFDNQETMNKMVNDIYDNIKVGII